MKPISQGIRERNIINTFLVLIIVAITGFTYFYGFKEYVIISFLILSFFSIYFKTPINIKILSILLIFPLFEIFQGFEYSTFQTDVFLSNLLRIGIIFLCISMVKRNFIPIYINIIFYFSILSLIIIFTLYIGFDETFWLPISNSRFFKPLFNNPNVKISPNIIIYTFNSVTFNPIRNCGPFWEPGAFGVFINIALGFNILILKKLVSVKNTILIITLLSTFSTSSYLGLIVIILGYTITLSINKFKYFYLFVLITTSIIIYFSLSFMNEKIMNNIKTAENTNGSRFGSALSDFKMISEKPFLGWGRSYENIYGNQKNNILITHRNNGLTKLAANYGIIVFIFYFLLYFINLRKISYYYGNMSKFYIFLFLSILILGFSQTLFNRVFFYSFLILNGYYNYNKNRSYQNNRLTSKTHIHVLPQNISNWSTI